MLSVSSTTVSRATAPTATAPVRRATLRLLSILALLLAMPASASGSDDGNVEKPAERSAIPWQPYLFEPADAEPVEAELGTITVPENRDEPGSRSIELSFVRFATTSKSPGAPIVYLAGGPGGSGITTARYARFPLFMALRAHADVIAFDQRGTGLSNPIPPCEFTHPPSIAQALDRSQLADVLRREAEHCREFWASEGVDLSGYDTAQSADDIEDLRQALGVPKLSLWGISYGTHLAFAAVARHPESFDRLVLASAEGPDETIKLPARTDAFFAAVDERVESDLVADLRAAFDRLEKEPQTVEVQIPGSGTAEIVLGKIDVQIVVGYLIKNPSTLQQLVSLAQAMAAGDFSHVAPIVARVRSGFTGLRGMPEAMDAASGISEARRRLVLEQRETALLGDALNFPMLPDWLLAQWLGVEVLPDDFRRPPSSDVPALFLSGSLDGRTYTESHRELAAGFSNATFVVVEGAGHDLFMSSPEVETRILDFLARGETSEKPILVPSFLDARPKDF